LALATLKSKEYVRLRNFTVACGVLAGLFLVGMGPILGLMAEDMRVNGDFLVEGLGFSNVFSNDVLGFFVPSDQHLLFGEWVRDEMEFAYLNFAFVGWVTLALAIIALLNRKTRPNVIFWALFAGVFALLSLGPTLRVNGREWELPLPFDALLQIPLIKANRYPSRYSVMVMFCLAVVATWGAAAVVNWVLGIGKWEMRNGKWEMRNSHFPFPISHFVVVGLGLLLLFEHGGAPLPLSDYRLPPIYEQVRGRAGGTLLDIPLAWRNGFRVTGTQHNSFMFAQAYQSYHGKRLLSGNTSRNPELKFQYFTELPVINSLIALETGGTVSEARIAADTIVAGELLRLLDAPTIVVRRLDEEGVTPEATLPYLRQLFPNGTTWYEDSEYVGLEVPLPAAPVAYEWDGHHPLARLFFAEGWGALPPLDSEPLGFPRAVVAEAAEARLLLPSIAAVGAWTLEFTATVETDTSVTVLAQGIDGGGW
jgi:hypothetical protein